jgi:hypothetical protein
MMAIALGQLKRGSDHESFAHKFRKIVEGRFKRYGKFDYDTEGEIIRYKARFCQ